MIRALSASLLTAAVALGQAPHQTPDPASQAAALDLSVEAVRINSIDPDNTDFADLAPLKNAIGDARVVVLGEQSHGDGAVFLAKARLVKFLHQEMGFDVLCWESGMLGCLAINDRLDDDSLSLPEAFGAVFPIWTMSAQVVPTLEYVKSTHATDRPITQVGLDAQFSSSLGPALLKERAKALLESLDGVEIPPEAALGLDLIEMLTGGMRPDPDRTGKIAGSLDTLAAFLKEHEDKLKADTDPREVELVMRAVSDAAWFSRFMSSQLAGETFDDNPDIVNERDRRMGDNLAWLAETYYPNRKIIVWAATRHAVHRQKEIEYPASPGIYDNLDSMGETAHDRLGEDLYTIGFTAGRGRAGNVFRPQTWNIGEPQPGSIEAALDALDHPFLFLDFRALPEDHALRKIQWMRPLGYAWQKAVWPDQMDAVIYIDEMFPSTGDRLAPEGYVLTVE